EEIKAVRDLLRRVDVEGGAMGIRQGRDRSTIAVQDTVAVGEGAGIGLGNGSLWQVLAALYWNGVRGFRNDDPGGDVGDGADTREDDNQGGDNADEIQVPSVVESETGTHAGDHAVVARASQLPGRRLGTAGSGWPGRADDRSTGCTE